MIFLFLLYKDFRSRFYYFGFFVQDSRRSDRFLGASWGIAKRRHCPRSPGFLRDNDLQDAFNAGWMYSVPDVTDDWNSSVHAFPLVFEFTGAEKEQDEKESQRFNSIYETPQIQWITFSSTNSNREFKVKFLHQILLRLMSISINID